MKNIHFSYSLCILVELLLFFRSATSFNYLDYFSFNDNPFDERYSRYNDDHNIVYSYSRMDEIKNQCSSLLSAASELKPDDDRGSRLKNGLSFLNGDWEQESGGSPLMPYDDFDMDRQADSSSLDINPLKLVSFQVTDVSSIHQLKNTASVGGIMSIGITRNSSFTHDLSLKFRSRRGLSVLTIVFEGVYIETNENGGERLLCLLGNSTLPYLNPFPSGFEDNYLSNLNPEPLPISDDQILLVIRYPQAYNLTRGAIQGEMKSLNERESIMYFDHVRLSSQLGRLSKYQFSSELIMSRILNFLPYPKDMEQGSSNKFNGSEFCKNLHRISGEAFTIVPNDNFNGGNMYNSKLGPFFIRKEIKTDNWSYENLSIIMQNINCEEVTSEKNGIRAKVSAIFRATSSITDRGLSKSRTGLSTTTLSAEGLWNSSSGQLLMIGCLGVVDNSGMDVCDSLIQLHFPMIFSISQRSIVSGSISSIRNAKKHSSYHLFFQTIIRPVLLDYDYYDYQNCYLSYNYTKINLASAFKEISKPSKLETFAKRSLLSYPALGFGDELHYCLSDLSNKLNFDAFVDTNSLVDGETDTIFVRMEVLSLGPLLGHYYPQWTEKIKKKRYIQLDDNKVLNISLHFMFTKAPLEFFETPYKGISGFFLEGLYDPDVGEMYLIACRTDSQDCLIGVKIEYASKTLRWLINPTVKMTIKSQRNEDDPLHFSPISFQTVVIRSDDHEKDVYFRKIFEGTFRIVMILVEIGIVLSQFSYVKRREDVIPYMSIIMLGIQEHELVIPLLDDSSILFRSKESASYRTHPYGFNKYETSFTALDYTAKLLVLILSILMLRLLQKVSASRHSIKNSSTHSKQGEIPNDKKVLRTTLMVITFASMLMLHDKLFKLELHINIFLGIWFTLAYDYFLVPQIIGNFLWKIHVKPLRKIYYIGFTLVRIILHVFDYASEPVSDPYASAYELINLKSEYPSNLRHIAAIVILIMLAIIVHVQQLRSY